MLDVRPVDVPPGEREPSHERADPGERRETRPEAPPPVESLPGEAEDQSLPGEVTSDSGSPSTAITSAAIPVATLPRESAMPSVLAASTVAERI